MEYAAYVIAIAALFIGFRLYRERQFLKSLRERKPSRSFRVCEPGGDPFEDRIEFHIRED